MLYPTKLANVAGSGWLYSAILSFAVQAAVIWAVTYAASKTGKGVFEWLSCTIGEWAACTIYGIYAAFFLISGIVPIVEQQLFVHEVFYDTIPTLLIFLPFFFFSIYACSKGWQNIGRTADICLPIFLVSILCLILMSFNEGKYWQILPCFWADFGGVAKGVNVGGLYFYDGAVALMLVDNCKFNRGDSAKTTLSYIAGGAVVLAVLAIFNCIYCSLAVTQTFAISKISIFFSAINLIGRIDLFAVYALDIVALFAVVLNLQCCVGCIKRATNANYGGIFSLAVNACIFIALLFINDKFTSFLAFAAVYVPSFTFLFAVFLPLALCLWQIIASRNGRHICAK
jgi:hypothetical protein